MNETARLIMIVVLASFAVERIVAAVDFVWSEETIQPEEKKRKLLHFLFNGLISLGVVGFTGIRILKLKFDSPDPVIDFVLTWLIMVGGADKLGQFLDRGRFGRERRSADATITRNGRPVLHYVLASEEYRVGDNPAEAFASLVRQAVNQ